MSRLGRSRSTVSLGSSKSAPFNWTSWRTTRYASGLTITTDSDSQLTANWLNNGTVDYDNICIAIKSDGANYIESELATGITSKVFDSLSADTLYYVKIRYKKGTHYSDYISAVAGLTSLSPEDVANLTIRFDADNVVNSSGKASQLTDLSGNDYHATNAGGTDYYPAITASALNGHNKLVFNGVKNRLLTGVFTQNQPYTVILLAKLNATTAGDKGFIGAKAANFSVLPRPTANVMQVFASLPAQVEASQSTDLSIFQMVMNTIGSVYIRNTVRAICSPGVNNLTTGLTIGGYADADSTVTNQDFYEALIYSGVLSGYYRMALLFYLNLKYGISLGVSQANLLNAKLATERLDDDFDNSVLLSTQATYKAISAFSEFSFNTTDEYLIVEAIGQHAGLTAFNTVAVYEDDVYLGLLHYKGATATSDYLKLSSGNKKVTLVSGGITKYGATLLNPFGCYITSIKVNNFTKVNEGSISTKIITIGDSISIGGDYATNPYQQAFSRLWKVEDGISSACLALGGTELKDYAENETAVNRTVGWVTSLFTNVTTRKILIVALGTNDFGISSTPAATFQGWYEDLLDAINVADSDIEVFCLSPLIRTGDGALLDDYRTAVGTVCTARAAYATHIAGKTILSLPGDFGADGLHPTVAGSKKLKDALDAVIFP